MNYLFIKMTTVGVVMILAVACGAAATSVPTATSIPQAPTPTPMVIQEWEFEGVEAVGDTVTVLIRVYAGIGIDVSIGGNPPSLIDASNPLVKYIFEDVAAGEHSVVISDAVGFNETASVVVEAPDPTDDELPDWLVKWVADLDSGKVEFPPLAIHRFQDQTGTVYYVSPQCCDQFSDLLDSDGNLIGHPDGGITGSGDGVTPFFHDLEDGEVIWSAR